jgi:hypothetical protein
VLLRLGPFLTENCNRPELKSSEEARYKVYAVVGYKCEAFAGGERLKVGVFFTYKFLKFMKGDFVLSFDQCSFV